MSRVKFPGALEDRTHSFWGGSNATWPLVKLEIYSDKLILNCFFFEKVVLLKSEITGITKYKGFFSTGVAITHSNPNTNPFILFWSRSTQSLLTQFEAAGYPIK